MSARASAGTALPGWRKKTPPPAVLLCDRDLNEQQIFICQLEEYLRTLFPEFTTKRFYGFDQDAAAIIRECQTYSLLSSQTLILVYEAEKAFFGGKTASAQLEKYLADPNPEVVLVLKTQHPLGRGRDKVPNAIAALCRKQGLIKECKISARSREQEIRKWVQTAGLQIESSAVKRLAELMAADRGGLGWCLQHLRDVNQDGVITENDVVKALAGEGEGNLWGFLDHVGLRDRRAFAEMEKLLRDMAAMQLLSLLSKRVRDMTIYRELRERGCERPMIAKTLGQPEWAMTRLQQQAGKYSLQELKTGLEGLAELDFQLKSTGTRQSKILFERWLAYFFMPSQDKGYNESAS